MANTDDMLSGYVDQIMNAHAEIDAQKEDQKEYYAALKEQGYDMKAVRKLVARKRKEREDILAEDEALYALENSLGMKLPDW